MGSNPTPSAPIGGPAVPGADRDEVAGGRRAHPSGFQSPSSAVDLTWTDTRSRYLDGAPDDFLLECALRRENRVVTAGGLMWIWVGPRWMRPGSRFSRVMWLVSLPVAVFMIWFGWTKVGPGSTGGGVAFLAVWTVGIIAIEIWNFRSLYLGRGRSATTVQRAMDERDAR